MIPSLFSCVLLISAIVCAAADKPDFAGTWKWTTTTQNGETRESSLNLKKESDKWRGTLKGPRAESEVQDIKMVNEEISFKVERETQRGKMVSNYKGKIQGDSIKGKVAIQNGDQNRERDWVATREGSDISGDWAWTMKRDNGEEWTAVLKIKKEGDKITGHFQRDGNDRNIELQSAKLSGSTLTFDTTLERDGQSTLIKNSATITGKTMKGKSEVNRDGQAVSLPWEATKK